MITKLTILSSFILMSSFTSAQLIDDLMFPNKKVIKKSKAELERSLIVLKDSLGLNNRQIKVRKFKLNGCDELLQYAADNGLLAEAIGFLKESTCQGVYSFTHRTNRKGSHYLTNHYFNEKGEVVGKDISWIVVTY